MHRLLFYILILSSFMGSLEAQDCINDRTRTQNIFIPDLVFTLTPKNVTDNSAVSFLSEAGRRNFRFNGTYGMLVNCDNLLKVSGEYLQQKLGYNFSSGKATRWMHQFAIGTAFRHLFNHSIFTDAEIEGYYSFAPGKHLQPEFCSDRKISRHIAGSSSYGFAIGIGINLWGSAHLQIDADYDSVIYHRKFRSRRHVEGVGGSFDFYQRLFTDFGLGLRGEFRRPYNYYKASFNWIAPKIPGLSIGIFGSHTRGKYNLPSNTTAGFELSCILGNHRSCDSCCDSGNWENLNPAYLIPTPFAVASQVDPVLKAWVSDPAVYIPEVLAIAEQKTCHFVTSVTIPNFVLTNPGVFTIITAPFFAGNGTGPLTFSATGLPAGATIDPSTGVITGTNLQDGSTSTVTVTASNNICSSSSQTFTIFFTPACSGGPTSTSIPSQSFCGPNPYSVNVSGFFTNSATGGPLVFSATGLPAGSTIDSATGVISGPNLQDNSVHSVTVTASNNCGQTSQTFTISFPCTAPTSTPIVPNPQVNPGSHTQIPLASFYTSPCGQPFTFSLTGSPPPGAFINPTTGVLDTGIAQPSGNSYSFNVVGTTTCGTTSQPLTILFQSS